MEFSELELKDIEKIIKTGEDKIFIFTKKSEAYDRMEKLIMKRYNYLEEDVMDGYFLGDMYSSQIEDGIEIYSRV